MAIVLNGTTGITAPDIDVTAQASDITTTGDITAVDATLSGGVYLGGTAAANYLDDYEEGTWTPTVENYDGDGSPTYTSQVGEYIKIGNMVHLSGYVTLSSWTNARAAADIHIAGLPFTSVTSSNPFLGVLKHFNCSSLDDGTTGRGLGSVGIESGHIHLIIWDSINYPIEDENLDGNETFHFSISYQVT